MRRRLPFLLSLVMLTACGGEEPPPATPKPPPVVAPPPPTTEPVVEAPPPKPPLAELQKQALGAALEGLNGHDAKKFASVYADDAVIAVAGLNEVSGREAIAQNMKEWFDTFSKVKLGFSRVWVKGDTMVLEWVINGTHSGELFGVKGTEQPIGHYGLSIVTFNADGKVTRENRYGELGTVMTQVGAAGKVKPRPIPAVPAAPETILGKDGDDEKGVATARSLLGALEGKKEADFAGLVTDDIEHDGLFHLETAKGKDEAKKFYKNFTTAFPDAKFEVKRAISIGDYAIVESTLKATHKGALGQVAATKRPVTLHLVDVFKTKDGKVARAWTYQNSLELEQELGLFQVKSSGTIPASQLPAQTAPKTPATPAPGPKPAQKGEHKGGGGGHGGGGGGHGGGGGGGGGKK